MNLYDKEAKYWILGTFTVTTSSAFRTDACVTEWQIYTRRSLYTLVANTIIHVFNFLICKVQSKVQIRIRMYLQYKIKRNKIYKNCEWYLFSSKQNESLHSFWERANGAQLPNWLLVMSTSDFRYFEKQQRHPFDIPFYFDLYYSSRRKIQVVCWLTWMVTRSPVELNDRGSYPQNG